MRLDTTIIYTSDIEKSIMFYRDLLGLELIFRDGKEYASFIFDNGSKLGIKTQAEERELPGAQTFIVTTPNLDNLSSRLKDRGIVFYSDIRDYPWGRHFSILDPDRNKIEFIESK